MLLSEAIRLGAMLRPQCQRNFFVGDGSCAWGSALEAVGLREEVMANTREGFSLVLKTFPIAAHKIPEQRNLPLRDVVWLKNDSGETRERIADWVEQEERKLGLIPEPQKELEEVHA